MTPLQKGKFDSDKFVGQSAGTSHQTQMSLQVFSTINKTHYPNLNLNLLFSSFHGSWRILKLLKHRLWKRGECRGQWLPFKKARKKRQFVKADPQKSKTGTRIQRHEQNRYSNSVIWQRRQRKEIAAICESQRDTYISVPSDLRSYLSYLYFII